MEFLQFFLFALAGRLTSTTAEKNRCFFASNAQVQPIIETRLFTAENAESAERLKIRDLLHQLTNSWGATIRVSFNIPDWLDRPLVLLALLYRRMRYGYAFRRIPLTQGKYAIVDPDDYERLSRHKWYAVNMKHTFYAQRGINIGDKRVPVMMHREILKVADGKLVDHINHNGLDNRKANLRPATRAENSRNRRKWSRRKCYSRFKGVCWHKYRKRWTAQIWFNGEMKYIGYFDDEIEAAKAYDEAARKHHKEFAVLNFPNSKLTTQN